MNRHHLTALLLFVACIAFAAAGWALVVVTDHDLIGGVLIGVAILCAADAVLVLRWAARGGVMGLLGYHDEVKDLRDS